MISKTIAHYKILKKLGQGGMGEVYLAEDTQLRRKVALKFLPLEYASDEKLKTRFMREAQAAAGLNHPNVVTVHEIDVSQDPPFIVMEYVEGESLKEWMAREALPMERVIEVAFAICEGLSAAHRAGVVHRDIKPANILIRQDGRVKIVDFGLAKFQDREKLTKSATLMGTVSYMSPEQILRHEADHQSDIFSFGVVLYEMLAGQLPFRGEYEATIIYAILNELPPPITQCRPGVPERLQNIVGKALAKDRNSRYQHIDDLLADLMRQKETDTKASPAIGRIEPATPSPEKRRSHRRLGAIAALALLAVVLVWRVLHKEHEPIAMIKTTLSISTLPDSATVLLEDKAVGVTPIRGFAVTAGELSLRLEKAGYFALDTSLVIEPDQASTFSFVLKKIPSAFVVMQDEQKTPVAEPLTAWGGLYVTSQPAEAFVLLDSLNVGATPYKNPKVKAGRHRILLHKNGYEDYSTMVEVISQRESSVHAVLSPRVGKLQVLVKPFGSIFIDGKLHQENTEFEYKTELSAGRHRIVAIHPAYGTWEKEIVIEPDRLHDMTIDFNKQVTITVASTPVWADIYVDGKFTGEQTTKQLALRIGQHTIEVRREGYVSESGAKVINLEDDVRESLVFILKKAQ